MFLNLNIKYLHAHTHRETHTPLTHTLTGILWRIKQFTISSYHFSLVPKVTKGKRHLP